MMSQIFISKDSCGFSHDSVRTYMGKSSGKIPHVLIVDRDMQQHRLLVGALRSIPYEVTVLENENQTYSRALLHLPDLIVLDLRLPKRQGLNIAQMLKGNPSTRHIPIIFVSALNEECDRLMGLKAGAVDYILKPYYVSEVQERIHIHISLSQQRAECFRSAAPPPLESLEKLMPANVTIKQIAKEYILSNMSDSTLKGMHIAAMLDLSVHHLNMVFEATEGLTVFEFIRNERMTRAAQMLKQTSMDIASIALEVGYPTPSNFSTKFKKFWQKSPLQYRIASQAGDYLSQSESLEEKGDGLKSADHGNR